MWLKKIKPFLFVLIISFIYLSGCGGSGRVFHVPGTPETAILPATSVSGQLLVTTVTKPASSPSKNNVSYSISRETGLIYNPLSNARIQLLGRTAVTDSNGFYTFAFYDEDLAGVNLDSLQIQAMTGKVIGEVDIKLRLKKNSTTVVKTRIKLEKEGELSKDSPIDSLEKIVESVPRIPTNSETELLIENQITRVERGQEPLPVDGTNDTTSVSIESKIVGIITDKNVTMKINGIIISTSKSDTTPYVEYSSIPDSNGKYDFTIHNLNAGEVKLRIEKPGYTAYEREMKLYPGISNTNIDSEIIDLQKIPEIKSAELVLEDNKETTKAVAGEKLINPPIFIVRDDSTKVGIKGIMITFEIVEGNGKLSSTTYVTDYSGRVADLEWTMGDEVGENKIKATIEKGAVTEKIFSIKSIAGSGVKFSVEGIDNLTAGVESDLTIKFLDSKNNVDTTYNGVKNIYIGGLGISPNGNYTKINGEDLNKTIEVTFKDGVALTKIIPAKAEKTNITISDGNFSTNGDTLTLDIKSGVATKFKLNGEGSIIAGVNLPVSITAVDSNGNVSKDYDGTKPLTFSGLESSPDGTASTIDDTPVTGNVDVVFQSGVADVNLKACKTGNINLGVGDGTISTTNDTKLSLEVKPASPSSLEFVKKDNDFIAGKSINGVDLRVIDQFGNIVDNFSGDREVTFSGSKTASDGTKPTTKSIDGTEVPFGEKTKLSFKDGVASPEMTLYDTENTSLSAMMEYEERKLVTSNSTSVDVSVNDGTKKLVFLAEPETTIENITFQNPVKIGLEDIYGNIVESDSKTSVTISLNDNPSSATLQGTLTRTLNSGIVSFEDLTIDKRGTDYSLKVSSDGITDGISEKFNVLLASSKIISITTDQKDGYYKKGDTIDFTVKFGSTVNVDTTNGIPYIAMNSGGKAIYVSGSGSEDLIFRYTISDNENSNLDYNNGTLELNGGTIKNIDNIDATLTLPQNGTIPNEHNIVIDTTLPVVTVDSLSTTDSTPPLSGTISETATVKVEVNGNEYTPTIDGNKWNIADNTITALGKGSYDVKVTATDNAGNVGTDSSSNELTITNTEPVGTSENITVVEDTPKSFTLTASDNEGDALTYTIVENPTHGTLSGTAPNLTYTPASNYNGTDTFKWKVNDGSLDSNIVTTNITVSSVDDAPVITAGGSINYKEGDDETIIDNSITITDIDDNNMESATVKISAHYIDGDKLYFTNSSTISGSWDNSTGTLTLTGSDTISNYVTALKSIKFKSSSNSLTDDAKTVSWSVNDGDLSSNIVTSTINVTPIVKTPAASPAAGGYATTQTVTLTCETTGATIVYTTDGTTPGKTNGMVYSSNPVTISSTQTIKAMAYKSNYTDSAILSNKYVITPFTYMVDSNNEITITGLRDGAQNDLTMPSTIDGKSVKYIGANAFKDSSITSLVIPDSVTSIGSGAFYGCSSLSTVTLSSNITTIESNTFFSCSSLSSINIPNGVTTIGENAFYNCSALSEVSFPDSLTTIVANSFYGCSSLNYITIPENVTSIGNGVFNNCSSLKLANFKGNAPATFGSNVFNGTDGSFKICYINGKTGWSNPYNGYPATAVTDPSYFTYTTDNDEITITGLNSGYPNDLVIPCMIDGKKVTKIGSSAFRGTTITSVTIPDSVTSIKTRAFMETDLTSITIPNSVTSIEESAFQNSTSLSSVTLSNSLTSLSDSIFYGCSSLTGITIPDGVTSLGKSAFCGCSLITSMTIPNGVTEIKDGCFWSCNKLANVTLPDNLTIIEDNVFRDCQKLNNLVIPSGVNSIGSGAFYNCFTMDSIDIPSNVNSIGADAFSYCSGLTSIVVPSGVNSIEDNAFKSCYTLKLASFEGNAPATFGNNVFDGTDGSFKICYINGKTGWSNPYNGYTATAVTDPSYFTYTTDNDEITITGLNSGYPNDLVIPCMIDGKKVTKIGNSAFYDKSDITSVVIPDSVTSIEYNAFKNCTSLSSVTLPANLTEISSSLFSYCSSLTSITIPSGVTSIDNDAFYKTGLTTVTIPDNVTTIGDFAFSRTGLTSVVVPDNVTTLGDSVFYNCTSLSSVTLSKNITKLEQFVFRDCPSLHTITIPDGVISIGTGVFESSGLTSVVIPDSVTSIGIDAFIYCGLTSVTIPDSVTSISDGAFNSCADLKIASFDGNAPATFGSNVFDNTDADFKICYINGKTGWSNPYNGYPATAVTDPIYFTHTTDNDEITITGLNSGYPNDLVIPCMIDGKKVTKIGNSAFQQNTIITSVVIPDSVTSIGSSAFYQCSNLSSVTLPDNLTIIEDSILQGTKISSITIPSTVTSIGYQAFYNTYLTSVVIPSSVTTIKSWAFQNSGLLTKATFNGDVPANFGSDVFVGTDGSFKIYYYPANESSGWTQPTWTVSINTYNSSEIGK